jgi:hypothetical protein
MDTTVGSLSETVIAGNILTKVVLEILYHDTGTRRRWKDELSDWILDTQPAQQTLDPAALLQHLRWFHPQVYERVLGNVQVRHEVRELMHQMMGNE